MHGDCLRRFRPVGPSHFLLRAQEKVTKEKGTPEGAPSGLLPSRCTGGLRGFSTAPPVLTKNWLASVRATLRAFLRPPAAPYGAPWRTSVCALGASALRWWSVADHASMHSVIVWHVTVTAVMPARAGIHGALMPKATMDARFRGHDGHEAGWCAPRMLLHKKTATGATRRRPRRMRACSSGPLGGGEGWAGRTPAKRLLGVPFSLVTFSWARKRK